MKNLTKYVTTIAIGCMLFVMTSVSAKAYSTDFSAISDNSGVSGALAGQFHVDVSEFLTYTVFTINNTGSIDSFIAQVYWDDTTSVLGSLSVLPSNWGAPATPANLPGGADPMVNFFADFSTDADNPQPDNGIHTGETRAYGFSGSSYADVVSAMTSGSLRVGLHVQGIGEGIDGCQNIAGLVCGESDSFVTPEPSSLLLLGSGLVGLALYRRRKKA